jgi:hypothetical protein
MTMLFNAAREARYGPKRRSRHVPFSVATADMVKPRS